MFLEVDGPQSGRYCETEGCGKKSLPKFYAA